MMMVPRRRQGILIAILMTALLLCGCGRKSTPVIYYTLSPLSYQAPDRQPAPELADLTFGVGPVRLPAYLDRSQIVSRTSPNRLRVNDFQRWAAPLDKDMARVLAENIKQLTGIDNCMVYPWPSNVGPNITVALTVTAFEAVPDGHMILNATIVLQDRRSRSSAPWYRTFYISRPFSAMDDYAAVVAAQNQVFGELSRQIAEAVETFIQ